MSQTEGSFRDRPAAGVETLEPAADIEALEQEISELEQLLAPFQTGLWPHFEGMLRSEFQTQVGLLAEPARQMTSDQVMTSRGRLQSLAWAIGLPDTMRLRLDDAVRRLEEAQQIQGEEAPDG